MIFLLSRWSVGALSEMYPDGKVGVDPVCVLGLNKNKGQEILLRLRTDDLLGFRKYLRCAISSCLERWLLFLIFFLCVVRAVSRKCSSTSSRTM